MFAKKNQNIILCERGVSAPHTHKSTSRFMLDIQAIPALKEYSCLPIISDPSHACFWHEWVKPLTLGSIATGADGIMIEFHENPRESAVDPLQAIGFKEFEDLIFAQIVSKYMNSNAIVLVKNKKTISLSSGQTSRVEAARIAINKLRINDVKIIKKLGNIVLASDGFFPFPDIIELCSQNKISAIIQPGGSINDEKKSAGRRVRTGCVRVIL